MSNKTPETKESWMALLYQKFIFCEKGTVEHDIVSIIQDLLSSDSDDINTAARTAAHQIDTYYWDRNLESGTQFRFQIEKDPYHDVQEVLFNAILYVVPLLHYAQDAKKQNKLVQLIEELRRIPPRPVKIQGDDRLVHPDDFVFADMLDSRWKGNFDFKDDSNQIVNFSAFLSRVIAGRVDPHVYIEKYPIEDIPQTLAGEERFHGEIKKDPSMMVMIAVQHILLAGNVIDEEVVRKTAKEGGRWSWWVEQWQLWADRFNELTTTTQHEFELDSGVKTAITEARKKMVSIHPELFPISEGGSKADH